MEVPHTGLKQAAYKLNVAAFAVRGSAKIKRSGQHYINCYSALLAPNHADHATFTHVFNET